jgi:MFS family permease
VRLINREFARLWIGDAVSAVGDAAFDTTVVLWIATGLVPGRSWAPLAVGGVLIAAVLPALLPAPLAGVIAGVIAGVGARRAVLGADAARAVLVAGVVVLAVLPPQALPLAVRLGAVYLAVLLSAAGARLAAPARQALVDEVVPPLRRPAATGLSQTAATLAGILGPLIAAPVLFASGVRWAFILNALTFVVSFIAAASVRVSGLIVGQPRRRRTAGRASKAPGPPVGARTGLGVIRRTPALLTLLAAAATVTVAAGALNVLDVFFLRSNLHAGPRWYGLLGAAFGLGSIAGALVATRVAGRVGLARAYWSSLLLTGVLLIGYAKSTTLIVALAAIGLVGVPVAVIGSLLVPAILKAAPREHLSVVFAVVNPAIQVTTLVSVAAASLVATRGPHPTVAGLHLGPIDSVLVAAGTLVVLAGLWTAGRLRDVPASVDLGEVATGSVSNRATSPRSARRDARERAQAT